MGSTTEEKEVTHDDHHNTLDFDVEFLFFHLLSTLIIDFFAFYDPQGIPHDILTVHYNKVLIFPPKTVNNTAEICEKFIFIRRGWCLHIFVLVLYRVRVSFFTTENSIQFSTQSIELLSPLFYYLSSTLATHKNSFSSDKAEYREVKVEHWAFLLP